MVKIKLGGILGKTFGDEWNLSVSSFPEALKAINVNTQGKFRKFLMQEAGIFYKMFLNGKAVEKNSELYHQMEPLNEIEIEPVLMGGLSKDFFGIVQIVVGASLIAGGIALGITTGWTGVGAAFAVPMIFGGLALLAGGVITLLTPTPKYNNDEGSQGASTFFNGVGGNTRQGTPVPVIYGTLLVECLPISTSISTSDDPTQVGQAVIRESGGGGKK